MNKVTLQDSEGNEKVIDLDARDRKAELTMLAVMENIPSQGGKREFAEKIGIEWDEYLRLRRKYKHILKRYEEERK